MNQTLKQILKMSGQYFTGAATVLSIYSFAKGIKDDNLRAKYELELNKNRLLENKVNELLENKITDLETKSKIIEVVNRRSESLDLARNEILKINEINSNLINSEVSEDIKENLLIDLNQHINTLSDNLSKGNNNLNDLIDIAINSSSSSSNKNFIANDIFTQIQSYLSYYKNNIIPNLTLDQLGAMSHIFACIFILLCLFSLIGVFYGDSLIRYFNLEIKYPKLAKYIQLRRKFQQYYFFINVILIILALSLIIYINILILIYK